MMFGLFILVVIVAIYAVYKLPGNGCEGNCRQGRDRCNCKKFSE